MIQKTQCNNHMSCILIKDFFALKKLPHLVYFLKIPVHVPRWTYFQDDQRDINCAKDLNFLPIFAAKPGRVVVY